MRIIGSGSCLGCPAGCPKFSHLVEPPRKIGDPSGFISLAVFYPNAEPLKTSNILGRAQVGPNIPDCILVFGLDVPLLVRRKDKIAAIRRLVPPYHRCPVYGGLRNPPDNNVGPGNEVGIDVFCVEDRDLTVIGIGENRSELRRLPGNAYDNDCDACVVARQIGPLERSMGKRHDMAGSKYQRPQDRYLFTLAHGICRDECSVRGANPGMKRRDSGFEVRFGQDLRWPAERALDQRSVAGARGRGARGHFRHLGCPGGHRGSSRMRCRGGHRSSCG